MATTDHLASETDALLRNLHASHLSLIHDHSKVNVELIHLRARLENVTKMWRGRQRDVLALGSELSRALKWSWADIEKHTGVDRPKAPRKGSPKPPRKL